MRGSDWHVPLFGFRLENLREWHVVEAECLQCHQAAPLRHAALKRGRDGGYLVSALEHKLRCTQCGQRGGHTIRIQQMPR